MPNLFVVGNQGSLAELAPSLLKSRLSAAVRESALDAVRRANPSLDLDRVTPGTVVVVPPVEGVRPAATDDPAAAAADELVARVRDGIGSLAGAVEQAEERRAGEKKEIQSLLGSAVVTRLAEQLPDLAANIESVRGSLKDDDARAKQQLADVRRAREVWESDLQVLRDLL